MIAIIKRNKKKYIRKIGGIYFFQYRDILIVAMIKYYDEAGFYHIAAKNKVLATNTRISDNKDQL